MSALNNSQVALKQPLQYRRPPAGLSQQQQQPLQGGSTLRQTNVSNGGGMAMRRVSSARMQQNVSVSESLQHFIASRSNSVARSQNDEEEVGDLTPVATEVSRVNNEQPRADSRASTSMERAAKYLRRDTSSSRQATTDDQAATRHNFKPQSVERNDDSGLTAPAKPPRASSQIANKQVRFDIKEGLRGMIKEQAPAFNAADVHRQLLDRKRQKMQTTLSQEGELFASKATSSELMNPPTQSTISPVFGQGRRGVHKKNSSVRKSSDRRMKNSAILSQQSSGRRYGEVISPTSSSSKKFAYNLALKYQKEVLESKVRKGTIDLRKLKVDDSGQRKTPKSTRMQPQKPNLAPDSLSQEYLQPNCEQPQAMLSQLETLNSNSIEFAAGSKDNDKMPIQQQLNRQNQQFAPISDQLNCRQQYQSSVSANSLRKAGQICRLRSVSPPQTTTVVLGPDTASAIANTQEDDEVLTPHALFLPRENQESNSMNRTFYAGQIVRNQKRPSQTRKPSLNVKQHGCSSETLSISYQPQLQPIFNNQPQQTEPMHNGAPDLSNNADTITSHPGETRDVRQDSQIDTSAMFSSYEPTLQANLSHPTIILQPPEGGGIFQHEDQNQLQQVPYQSSEYSHLQDSAHFPHAVNNGGEVYADWTNGQEIMNTNHLGTGSFWDLFLISENDFHRLTPQFTQQVEFSKQALHEPLREDEEAAGLSSVRLASQGLSVPHHRLHLIRVHLRNVLLDSFMPLILEIIQLRDRLAYRKYTYKLAIKQPLKASIITDICSRLRQKIVIKVFFLQSQFKKNLHSLFSAYIDLLVKKQIIRASFDVLRTFRQRQVEKTAYLDYAKEQVSELRKVQVFDAMRRFAPLVRLEREKYRQAARILSWRKMARVAIVWQIQIVGNRTRLIGETMAQRFRYMKLRHQLFANWVNANRVNRQIKAKALKLVNKGQDERQKLLIGSESEFDEGMSEQSGVTLREQEKGQAWLQRVKAKSEEIFCRQTQELLLEKEHLFTCIRRLYKKMRPQELNLIIPVTFDKNLNPQAWDDIKPSQALLSNKEQIYTQFPELQQQTMTALPVSLLEREKVGIGPSSVIQLQASACDLNKALLPPLQKFMVNTNGDAPEQIIDRQQQVLSSKYSVHEALVAQQNLYGLQKGASSTKQQQHQHVKNVQQTESDHLDHQYHTFYSVEESQAARSMITHQNHASIQQQSTIQSNATQRVQAVPFKRQASIVPITRSSEDVNEKRPPNQLFMRLKQQAQIQGQAQSLHPLPQQEQQHKMKLPPEVQLNAHLRNMLALYRQCQQRQGDIVRAKSLALVLRDVAGDEGSCSIPDANEGMSLSDFTQVVMQTGLSMLHLNDIQIKYRFIEKWRQRLVLRLLEKDLDQYRGFQAGRSTLREWRSQLQKRKLRAVGFWRTRQMQNFYSLFTKWARANRQLVYETERQVRNFRARIVLTRWRAYYSVNGKQRKVERAAIQFYVRSLLARALASMCQNRNRLLNCKRFERRKVLIKFFKRNWLPKCRARQLLRTVLEKCCERDLDQDRPRYQRQIDAVRGVLHTWRKRVEERHTLYKTYLALNHYKLSLVFRAFQALRDDPAKNRAAAHMMSRLQWIGLQKPFDQMLRVCAEQNLRARELREQRQAYICQQFVAHLHAMAVKSKLAKLFVQRKYLKAFQTYIFKHNYVRPLAFREHQLKTKAFVRFQTTKGQRWKRQRLEIVYRALLHRKRKTVLAGVMNELKNFALAERRDRIIDSTVQEFRKHTLLDKSFKLLKYHRMNQCKKNLLNQVAYEFHEERIRRRIESGRTHVQLNTQTGCLLNANQALLLSVLTEWRFISKSQKKTELKLSQQAQTRSQMLLLRCFLAWRSFARYEQSEISVLEGGGTRSAISYLEVIDDMASNINMTYDNGEARRHSSLAMDNNSVHRVGNRATSTISYINTDVESVQHHQIANAKQQIYIQPAISQSSNQTSYVNSSQQQFTTSGGAGTQMSIGQIRDVSIRRHHGGRNPSSLTQDHSESTLNARAGHHSHLNSSSNLKHHHDRATNNSALISNQSSSQLNQRMVAQLHHKHPSHFGGHSKLADSKRHQHHASVPEYAVISSSGDDRQDVLLVNDYTPGMYQDTSEFASKTAGGGEANSASVASFSQQNFGGVVGRGHKHDSSNGQETELSPQDFLSMNDVENNQEGEHFSYEQIVEDNEMGEAERNCEPTLVTTLKPYNYEFDLPLKQDSYKHTCQQQKQSQQQPMQHPVAQQQRWLGSGSKKHQSSDKKQEYATFSKQECQQVVNHHQQHQQSSESHDHHDQPSSVNSSVESDNDLEVSAQYYQQQHQQHQSTKQNALRGADQAVARKTTLEHKEALQKHLGSLTISNGSEGRHRLCEELDSLFRAEDDLQVEQMNREQLLKEMASHYQTRLTSKDETLQEHSFTSFQVAHGAALDTAQASLSIMEGDPHVESQSSSSNYASSAMSQSQEMQQQQQHYAPDCFVESQNSSQLVNSGYYISASFAAANPSHAYYQQKDYEERSYGDEKDGQGQQNYDQDEEYAYEEGVTQEDEEENLMDRHN